MPIYAYKCGSCGHAKDVLQKMSDVPLTVCPVCGAEAFSKQLTAAGFQLKGSGWYATDFKGGAKAAPASGEGDKSDSAAKPADAGKSGEGAKTADAPAPSPAEGGSSSTKTAAPAPATPPAPAPK